MTDEVLEQLLGAIAVGEAMLLKDLVGELGASLEGETFRLHQGVVAIEEDVFDLEGRGRPLSAGQEGMAGYVAPNGQSSSHLAHVVELGH